MRKILASVVVAGAVMLGSVGVSAASHPHFVQRTDQDGVRHCQYIAEGQTSKNHEPMDDTTEPGGGKFHENVHTAQPGDDTKGTDFGRDTQESDMCHETHERGLR